MCRSDDLPLNIATKDPMKNTTTWRLPYSRDRFRGAITRPSVNPGTKTTYCGTTPGTYTTVNGGARLTASSGEVQRCTDVVTPGHTAYIASGGIINNPYMNVRCTCTEGGLGQKTQFVGSLNPWPVGSGVSLDVTSTLRTYDARYYGLGATFDATTEISLQNLASLVDIDRSLREAKTSAMSKVDQSNAAGLVGLGELKQTLLGLANPLTNIRRLISRLNSKSARKGSLKLGTGEVSSAVANDYLAYYYGLLPFCRDLESYLDAYIKSAAQKERVTARGSSSDSKTVTENTVYTPVVGASSYSHRFTKKEELVCRSGILYVPSPLTWQKSYGLRFSDGLDAAYQLVPWSFMLDYFSNMGKFIGAITPRLDVRYLTAWDVTTLTITDRAECTGGGMGGTDWVWSRGNTEWAERVVKATFRSPASPNSGAGIVFDTGNWSSKQKVMAMLSLIIQQLPNGTLKSPFL